MNLNDTYYDEPAHRDVAAWDSYVDECNDEGIEPTPDGFETWCENEAERRYQDAMDLAEKQRNEGYGYY